MMPDRRDPKDASRAGVVVVRDDPWVLLYLPALDRLTWVDLRVPDKFPDRLPGAEQDRQRREPERPA